MIWFPLKLLQLENVNFDLQFIKLGEGRMRLDKISSNLLRVKRKYNYKLAFAVDVGNRPINAISILPCWTFDWLFHDANIMFSR